MTTPPLPLKLKKEPLVDAVFEIRFSSKQPMGMVLPGLLISKLTPEITGVERLPMADVPIGMREADPRLRGVPTVRLDWSHYFIVVGDHSVGIACKIPYSGWILFRAAIREVLDIVSASGYVKTLERYSTKYVNLIPGSDSQVLAGKLKMDLSLGRYRAGIRDFQVRVEVPSDPFLQVINLASGVTVQSPGSKPKQGLVIDIDTMFPCNGMPMAAFMRTLDKRLAEIHEANKETFFSCLTDQTIHELDAVYE